MRSLVARCAPALLAAALAPGSAAACSTCKCGDYTLTLLGSEKSFSQRLRLGVDYIVRSESAGAGEEREHTDEWRTLFSAAYGFSEDFSLAVQVPYVRKEIESSEPGHQLRASGLGDIDVVSRYVLYRSGAASGRHLAGLRLGVRLPTSEEIEKHGEPLEIDVQPDAGATAPNFGGWYSYFRFPWFMTTSLNYYRYGDGRQHFEPGDAATGSVLGQYAFGTGAALQLGLDARHAQGNRFSGVDDPDSGGLLATAFTGVALRAFDELLLSAGVQVPVVENLKGEQDEGSTFRFGLVYDF